MRIFKNKGDSLKYGLSFFLILGSILGTLFCNEMNEEMKIGLTTMEHGTVTRDALSKVDFVSLFFRIFPKRMWALMLVLLASATSLDSVLLMFAACYLGFSNAILICTLTMSTGIGAAFQYLVLIFPQCLLYVPVIYLLFWWMPANERHLTPVSFLFLFLVTLAGTVVECFVNPWVLAFFKVTF